MKQKTGSIYIQNAWNRIIDKTKTENDGRGTPQKLQHYNIFSNINSYELGNDTSFLKKCACPAPQASPVTLQK